MASVVRNRKGGLADIPAQESFAIRQILLVGQERPSEEDSKIRAATHQFPPIV
jgi:hypothetical protein